MRYLRLLVIIAHILFLPFIQPNVCAQSISVPDDMRVIVADKVSGLNLSVRGPYRITTIETDEVLKKGKTFFNVKIAAAPHGIYFGKDYLKIYAIHIVPERDGAIYLNKRLYQGTLQILRTKKGFLRAINLVNLEDYLRGVLYHEVSHRWPLEAIKAQAIVSRTFALYQAQENRGKYYYLTADVSSQVYGGVYAHKYRTNQAVTQTQGEVILYKNEVMPAFFHATCGGRTEEASQLWKVNMAPLRGISCQFCKHSPHYNWSRSIDLADIEKKLSGAGYSISGIKAIRIQARNKSGRVVGLLISSNEGITRITAKDFRNVMGPSLIKSTNFTVNIHNRQAHFTGHGWGHGVGMCQWGAFALAKKGWLAEDIIRFYYPRAKIVKLDTPHS